MKTLSQLISERDQRITELYFQLQNPMPIATEESAKDREIFTGKRGGRYFINDFGNKVYITKGAYKERRNYKPRPGAFARFTENQNDCA